MVEHAAAAMAVMTATEASTEASTEAPAEAAAMPVMGVAAAEMMKKITMKHG
jgi:hypothetical protein